MPLYGDGTTSRDYTYIDDIVQGVICALNKLGGFHIYNLGGSKSIKLSDLINIIELSLNKRALLYKRPLQPGDVQKTFAEITKARNELGYAPKFDIRTGIQNFVTWYHAAKCYLYE